MYISTVNIFQQKDKGTKFFSVRYNILIISLEGVGDKKLMSVSLVVFIAKGHASKGLIFINSVELYFFNNILMYMQHGRATCNMELLMYHFCFNFIHLLHTGHANFDFN